VNAQGGIGLLSLAENWPTAKVQTGAYSYANGDHNKPVLNLEGAAEQWQTPHSTPPHASNNGETSYLARQVRSLCSPPDPATSTPGDESSSDTPTSRPRLNPEFVTWLMGWPPGWTDFGCSATALSLWKRRMRSSLYGLVCRMGVD
jgi:hypothetical protein